MRGGDNQYFNYR